MSDLEQRVFLNHVNFGLLDSLYSYSRYKNAI